MQSLYHADLEYVLDIAAAANCADYVVTHSLTHSLTHNNFHICVMDGFLNLHYLSTAWSISMKIKFMCNAPLSTVRM